MIVKKIPNAKKSSSKSARIVLLGNYIADPERENGVEKCIHHEAHNFLTMDYQAQLAEMVALASETRSKDPVDHWVISWREDEQPTIDQARQAVEIFIEHCGLQGHQFIWGFHDDTENKHVHIQVNRVHPDTLKVTKINKGFDKEAGQQVGALIEHVQGWQPEKGSRYLVVDGKPVRRTGQDNTKSPQPTAAARAMEQQTGAKSAQRIGIEEAAPIISEATTWRELHANLAAIGMRYERKGSGAIIFIGDVPVKASDVSRSASLSALQKRFGAYQPAKEIHPNDYHHHTPQPYPAALREKSGHGLRNLSECRLAVLSESGQAKRSGVLHIDARPDRYGSDRLRRDTGRGEWRGQLVPLKANQPGWNEYQGIREVNKAEKEAATLELRNKHAAERNALFKKHKAERTEIFASSWVGRGDLRNAMQSVLATKQAAERLELQERLRAEREALWAKYKLPTYKEWQEQPQILGEKALENDARLVILQQQPPQLSKLVRDLSPSKNLVLGYVTYSLGGVSVFRDHGKTLAVLDQSEQSIAMALAVAQTKFGSTLTLTGPAEFQRKCVAVAVSNNLSIKFADPQLEAYRQQLVQEKRQASSPARRDLQSKPEQQVQRAAAPAAEVSGQAQKQPAPRQDSIEVDSTQDHQMPTVEEWIASNNRAIKANAGDVEQTGKVEYIAPDGRWIQSLGRGVVAVRQPTDQPLELGKVVRVGKDGQVQAIGRNEKGQAR